ncbi:MAG TPA: hypothetical protein VK595_14790 [Vicinamibacterales bacterium]|nr:hypothetical protein [Vicinamibacterales bacterium]
MTEVERVFPGRGVELANLWRTRQFEYSWLRSMSGRYVDFLAITSDALVYAAHALNLELTAETKQQLLDAYLRLSPWPDTVDALRRLKASGIHIITIANFSWCTRRSWRVRIAILSPQNGPNIVDLRRLFGSTRVELVHGGEPISTARKWVSRPVYPRFRARSRERRRIQPASQFFR